MIIFFKSKRNRFDLYKKKLKLTWMTRSKLGDPGKIYDLSLEPNQLGIGFKNSNFHTKKETCR
jgi:hypothetical protein